MREKDYLKCTASFLIALIIFVPFYVSDVYAIDPVISGVQVNPTYNLGIVTWNTDIASTSLVEYGLNNLVELSKTSGEVVTAHTIELGPLVPDSTYYYRVKSCSGSDCTESSMSTFQTGAVPAPGQATGLVNGSVERTTVALSWDDSNETYFDYYLLYRNGQVIANISSKFTVDYVDSDVTGGTTYQYQVSVTNSYGVEGEKSNTLYVTTQTPDTVAPVISNVSISSISLNSITIEWVTDENSNSTVYYGPASYDLSGSSASYETFHSVTLTGLQNDTTYSYKVASCDIDGNCAEQPGAEAFVPTEIVALNIDLEVPLIYNSGTVPVNGTVTADAKVKFFVNDIYKGIITASSNTDGIVNFNVPGFSSGNNTLRSVVEDAIGNTEEQIDYVSIDTTPPDVDFTPLPSSISSESVSINGTTNEDVTVNVYVTLLEGEDTTAPGTVTNLHTDTVEENSIEIAWNEVSDDDFDEYIIYRDGVAIGTTVSSPYDDDYVVSSGTSYKYEVKAIDTNCNLGNAASITVTATAGGVTYNESPEAISIPCLDTSTAPDYTFSASSPSFTESASLEQGTSEVKMEALDAAGNAVTETYRVYYDSVAPEIYETNLDTLTPSYIRDVTITGTVSEDGVVCVYINSEAEISPYRASEVNNTYNGSESRFCESTTNKTFSIDVELQSDPDYAYDAESQTSQTTSIFASTRTAWKNNVKVIAFDSVGLQSDAEENEIIYSLCGTGGAWSVIVDDVSPTEIVPRHLLEGIAQVSFSLDLTYRGSGSSPGVTDVDVIEGYPVGMSDELDAMFDDEWVSSIHDSWSDEYDKGYILIDLKAQDPFSSGNGTVYDADQNITRDYTTYEKELNLSQHNQGQCFNAPFTDQSYMESAGCVRIPLTIMISYESTRRVRTDTGYEDRKETITQKECADVEVLIQPRLDPSNIPDDFLEGAVDFLNSTIELIDDILEPLEQIMQATMIGCFAMWAVLYLKKVSEGFSCWNVNVNSCSCTVGESSLTCTNSDGDEDDDCKSCVEAKINTKNFEKTMEWVCDRIMCPAVPSYDKYIVDNSQNEKSNCYGKTEPDYEKDIADDASCKKRVKGLVSKEGHPIQSDTQCCDEEYLREWDSGAVMMNELKESKNLANPEEDNQFSQVWRSISDFKLCRPGDQDERQINIEGQWFIIKDNPAYDEEAAKEQGKDYGQLKSDVWTGVSTRERILSEGQILNDSETIEPGQKLTGTKIVARDCGKYGRDTNYKFGERLWPKYDKTTSTEITTRSSKIPSSFAASDVDRIFSGGESYNKNTNQLTADGITYTYKEEGNNYVIAEVDKGDESLDFLDQDGRIFVSDDPDESKVTQKNAPVPETIVREACFEHVEDYIINPPDSIFRSFQAVCLTALYSYLKMYRQILGLIRDCFQTILITGDGSSGVCQAVLSYYVCDLLYYLFSCFKGYSGFGAGEQSRGGIIGFFEGVVGSGAEVQEDVSNRYGDTNMFNVMFVDKKIVQAACLSFFGADTDIDLTAMAEQSITMPIASTVSVMPATRRFVGYNPIDGVTNHVYHVGMMIVSGSDNMRYNTYLVCSTDNSCNSNYFENGRCDCSYNGVEITKDITTQFGGNGRLDQGGIINEEAFITLSYTDVNARVRYDKVRVEYDYLDNTGNIKTEKIEKEISQTGSSPIASCQYDILSGYYKCAVFEEPTTACITDGPDIEVDGTELETNTIYDVTSKDIEFNFKARKETSTGDTSRKFFAVLEITDGSRTLTSQEHIIESTTESTYEFDVNPSSSWFEAGTSYSCSTTGASAMGITVGTCDEDAEISCTKTDDKVTFTIDRDSGSDTTCEATSKGVVQGCGSYTIELTKEIADVNCAGDVDVDRQISSSSSSATAASKSIDYTLTMYRPQTDNPRSKSDTIAKCNGIEQQEEGSFTIYSSSDTSSDSGTSSGDDTKPSIDRTLLYDVAQNNRDITSSQTIGSGETLKVVLEVSDVGNNLVNGKIVYELEDEEYSKTIRDAADISFLTTMPEKLHEEDITISINVEDAAGTRSSTKDITLTITP